MSGIHAPSRLRRPLHSAGAGLGKGRVWVHDSLSRAGKLFVLLAVISLALSLTTFLQREGQLAFLKAFLVFVLSLIPGWLYLQFLDSKAGRLYDEYVLNLFRLKIDKLANLPKPPPGSSYWREWTEARDEQGYQGATEENVYMKKFEAVYGEAAIPSTRKHTEEPHDQGHKAQGIAETIKTERFSPVIVTTTLLALGWIAFVGPEAYRNLSILNPSEFSGSPDVPVEPLRFGFLGAYAFILQSFVRRYFSSDLKTRAFVGALLRVVLVAALVVVVHPIWTFNRWPPELEVAFAFLVGYFPDFALRLIKTRALGAADLLRNLPGVRSLRKSDDEERFPLKELDGLNFWYEARLVEEGVENMQNLSTTSVVDLMVSTRTPVARLIDWIDQAYLYLRVTDLKDRNRLRRAGIRNATDLIGVYERSKAVDDEFHQRLLRLLNTENGKDDDGPSALQGIKLALEGEVNLIHVRHYRAHEWLDTPPVST